MVVVTDQGVCVDSVRVDLSRDELMEGVYRSDQTMTKQNKRPPYFNPGQPFLFHNDPESLLLVPSRARQGIVEGA